MDTLKIFVDKLIGLLTSQRFVATVATLIVSGIVLFNFVAPLFNPDFDQLDVPDEVALNAQLTALAGQLVTVLSFFFGVIAALWKLVDSIKERPPVNKSIWWGQ